MGGNTSSSFYTDGETYDTATVTSNDQPGSIVPSQAPSSFYQEGEVYDALQDESVVIAEMQAILAQAQASQADAAAHDSSAGVHDSNSATSAATATTEAATATTEATTATTQAGIATTEATTSTTQAGIATAAATAASTSEGNSAASATTSTNAATISTTQAGIATTQATAASSSATSAAGHDTSAGTHDTNAAASATAAATSATNAAASVQAAKGTAAPLMDGTAAVGTSTLWAHQDHVHPTDTTRAPLASPGLTGTPTAPTATAGDNTTKIATTAFVSTAIAPLVGAVVYKGTWNASTNSPALVSGTGTKGWLYKVSVAGTTTIDGISSWNVGDSLVFDGTVWDKIDGVPTEVTSVAGRVGAVTLAVADVSGAAPLASPALTGTPTAPTATVGDNSTTLATTAFVLANSSGTGVVRYDTSQSLTAAQQTQARSNIGSVSVPDVIVEEQYASGGNGGTFTLGSWITRALNTLMRNANSIASLASNQITLPAGTYFLRWSAPAFQVTSHKTKIQNITDATVVAYGTTDYTSATDGQSTSIGSCVLTITSSKAIALQHQGAATKSGNGFGVGAGLGVEIFSRLEITKLA